MNENASLRWQFPFSHLLQLVIPKCTVATEIRVKLIHFEYFVAFAFALIFIGTDDTSHSCSHTNFTPNLTFAFAFVIQKVINSEIILFRFALISVSMVLLGPSLKPLASESEGLETSGAPL